MLRPVTLTHVSQANGALMRVSPLGIWGAGRPPQETANAARQDVLLTHPNLVCAESSAAYAATIARAIASGGSPHEIYDWAVEWARSNCKEQAVIAALESAASRPPSSYVRHQGWVLVALQNAFFQLLHAPSLEDGVVQTVRAGGDTDTNAAIAGALLGAVHGRDAVPAQWQQMVISCRPMLGHLAVDQPRPAMFWPADAMALAERLLIAAGSGPAEKAEPATQTDELATPPKATAVAEWDGITRPQTLRGESLRVRIQLADAAKNYDWPTVLRVLDDNPELINATRPGGTSRYTVLHQAAHGDAPVDVVTQLVNRGGWLTARNAHNQRPLDVAEARGATNLIYYLTPRLRREIAGLGGMQQHLHELIQERAADLVRQHSLRLPELEPLLEIEVPKMWFAIPGMYGGFLYWLSEVTAASEGEHAAGSAYPVLVTESWCRVVGGSGQCHVVTRYGYTLVADGIV